MFDVHVVKEGIVSREYGEMFRVAFNLRQKCDYEVYTELNRSETEEVITSAEKFIKKIGELLKQTES